jgi:hypothetical protein
MLEGRLQNMNFLLENDMDVIMEAAMKGRE